MEREETETVTLPQTVQETAAAAMIWERYPGGDSRNTASEGSFVTIGQHGGMGISVALVIGIPLDRHYMRIEYARAQSQLRLTPLAHYEDRSLRIQKPTAKKGRQLRIATGSGIRDWGIVVSRAVRYEAKWLNGSILVDLNAVFKQANPTRSGASTEDNSPPGQSGDAGPRGSSDGGPTRSVASEMPSAPSSDPVVWHVRCAVCGRVVQAVRRGRWLCAMLHEVPNGIRCTGGLKRGEPVGD